MAATVSVGGAGGSGLGVSYAPAKASLRPKWLGLTLPHWPVADGLPVWAEELAEELAEFIQSLGLAVLVPQGLQEQLSHLHLRQTFPFPVPPPP